MGAALVLALTCSALSAAPDEITASLAFDRDAILAGQIWRCWTGHMVHFSLQHALPDIIALYIVTAIMERETGCLTTTLMMLLGAPLLSLCLLLAVPDLRFYEGASGISMLSGVAAGCVLWHTTKSLRPILGLLAAVVLIKVWLEALGTLPAIATLPDGVHVSWQAHAIGAGLGALFASLLPFWARKTGTTPVRAPTTGPQTTPPT